MPTEWSITTIDDILARSQYREVLRFPGIDRFRVFGHAALANNVQILLFPSAWNFEAQKA